jgi:hypothetical protein
MGSNFIKIFLKLHNTFDKGAKHGSFDTYGIIMHSKLLFLKFLSHYIDEHICGERRVPYKMVYNIPICLMFSSHKVIYVETHYVHIGFSL